MDRFQVDYNKCIKCYDCMDLCRQTYKEKGFLGFLILDYDGFPDYWGEYCQCFKCMAEINGINKAYVCEEICKENAIKIRDYFDK